jgi:hypothetical protein
MTPLIAARAALVASLEAEDQRPEAEVTSRRTLARGLLADGRQCFVELHRVEVTDWVRVRLCDESAWLSPVAAGALAEGLDGVRRESDMCKLAVEVVALRQQRDLLQADCTRHEQRARVEAYRAAWHESTVDYLTSDTGAETAEALAKRETMRRALAEIGAKP